MGSGQEPADVDIGCAYLDSRNFLVPDPVLLLDFLFFGSNSVLLHKGHPYLKLSN